MPSWRSKTLKRLFQEISGQTAVIFGLCFIPIVTVAGFAIDFQMVTTKKVKAQFALDSAVIAGSRLLQENMSADDVRVQAQQYFIASMEETQGSLVCQTPTVTINAQDLNARTMCSQATILSSIAGVDELRFPIDSAATFAIGKVDVSFVFDVSGSMDGSRMDALKDAAKTAVEQLLPENPMVGHEDDVRLAMVAYNNSLNAGDLYEAVTGQSPDQSYTSYSERRGRYITRDYSSTCVFQRSGTEKFSDAAPGIGQYVTPAGYQDRDDCREAEPLQLTTNRTALNDYIDALDPDGGTAGHLGVAWGWYMISPEWAPVLTADPLPYDEPDAAKALILMTDGAFNATINSAQGSSTWQAKQLCDNVKDEGVLIYSVAFQAPSAGEAVLSYCASGPEFFFDPQDGEELTQSYQAIATSISDLRLTQ